MSAEDYKAFLRATGHEVIEAAGAYWSPIAPRFMMSFPFDRELDSAEVARSKVLRQKALGARFLCQEDQGNTSWKIVCETPNYDIENLAANARSKVRRGLKSFEVRPVKQAELATDGIRLNRETMLRQGRSIGSGFDTYWGQYFSALAKAESADVWGAVSGGELAAYCVAFRMESVAHLLLLRSSQQHLSKYVNNALIFGYLKHALSRSEVSAVSFGLAPMQGEMPLLLQFKESMGFVRKPVRQAIVLRAPVDSILRSRAGPMIRYFALRCLSSERADKAAGMIDWVRTQPRLTFTKEDAK